MIGLSIDALRSIEDVSSRTLSIAFLTSSISVSRIASSNWRWKSEAARRSLPAYLPKVRIKGGRSLGPTTTIATTAITRSSDQPMSNMDVM